MLQGQKAKRLRATLPLRRGGYVHVPVSHLVWVLRAARFYTQLVRSIDRGVEEPQGGDCPTVGFWISVVSPGHVLYRQSGFREGGRADKGLAKSQIEELVQC